MLHGRMTRRRFFFLSAGLAGAGGAARWLSRKPIRLGLIGAGAQGRNLAGKVSFSWYLGGLHGRIIALCDVDRRHARQTQLEYCRDAEIYRDYRRVVERD